MSIYRHAPAPQSRSLSIADLCHQLAAVSTERDLLRRRAAAEYDRALDRLLSDTPDGRPVAIIIEVQS